MTRRIVPTTQNHQETCEKRNMGEKRWKDTTYQKNGNPIKKLKICV